MKRIKASIIIIILFCSLSSHVFAQYNNTLYFMDEIAERNQLNPAFTPNCKSYFDFIFLPNIWLSAGSNNLTLKDFVFVKNGETQSLFTPGCDVANLCDKLPARTRIDADLKLNILNFGWQTHKKNFYSLGINMRSTTRGYITRDLLRFGVEGTPDADGVNHYDFSATNLYTTLYNEYSFGYARIINEKWSVGGRAKLLSGYANVSTEIDALTLDASRQNWTLHANGRVRGTIPVEFKHKANGELELKDYNALSASDYFEIGYNPCGWGAAIDAGVTYKPIPQLTLSAAVTDLGFIYWNRYTIEGSINGKFTYEGVVNKNLSDESDENVFKKLGDDISDATHFSATDAYSNMIVANGVFGAEYGILKNKISFGALYRAQFTEQDYANTVTLSANFRPANWFKTSVSYTLLDGGLGNIGLGLNLRLGAVNMYMISDFIPVSWATYNLDNGSSALPYESSRFNVQMGIAFNIGCFSKDLDNDGVRNRRDKCNDTDLAYLQKRCPELKRKALINREGCIFDSDSDGVHDCYDQCPNTPQGVEVDSAGCPLDEDGDGVPDSFDKCLRTPVGVLVDNQGCPLDTDGDGIADYLDECPGTSTEAYGTIDFKGCPKDDDQDGVPNYLDLCPETPLGVIVDQHGCPLDADNDGIPDYLDQCPDTPLEALSTIDEHGCPKDSDQDGVPDYLDKCPNTPEHATVDTQGCP